MCIRDRVGTSASRHMPVGERLFNADQPITEVHFPLTGVMSMVTAMEDGSNVEVATVGNEGMVGMPVYFGVTRTRLEAFSQVPGDVIPVATAVFQEEVARSDELRDLMN